MNMTNTLHKTKASGIYNLRYSVHMQVKSENDMCLHIFKKFGLFSLLKNRKCFIISILLDTSLSKQAIDFFCVEICVRFYITKIHVHAFPWWITSPLKLPWDFWVCSMCTYAFSTYLRGKKRKTYFVKIWIVLTNLW